MMNMQAYTTEQRVYEFSCDICYNGGSVDRLLKKWGLEYRKGKTVADIKKARQLSFKNENPDTDFAMRVSKIVKEIK